MKIRTSQEIGKLAGALAKAQGAYKPVARSRTVRVKSKSTGTEYEFSYAPLDVVLEAVRPALAANGLAVTQEVHGPGLRLTTTMMHESGEWRASTVDVPGQSTTAQEFGSRLTYIKRYTLLAILCVVAEEDDDANVADGNGWQDKPRGEPRQRSRVTASSAQGNAPSPPAQPPTQKAAHPIEARMLEAKIPKQLIQRWLLNYAGTANWSVIPDAWLPVLDKLATAWISGGDEGHAAEHDRLKDEIAALKAAKA